METIIAAVITAILSLVGVVYATKQAAKETDHKMQVNQAVTTTKLEELTREVREHNQFARRMPVVEEQIRILTGRMDEYERRMNNV